MLAANPSNLILQARLVGLNEPPLSLTGRLMVPVIPIIAHSGVTSSSYVIGIYPIMVLWHCISE